MTGAPFYTLFPVYALPHQTAFTVDDSWNRYLEKHGDSISLWTHLFVECMLACGTYPEGVRRYCCATPHCTHSVFTASAVSQRPAGLAA